METAYDLFRQQKENGLLSSFGHFEEMAMTWIENDLSSTLLKRSLQFGILTSLWGNKKDLSLWPASSVHDSTLRTTSAMTKAPPLSEVVENILSSTSSQILDNHLDSIIQHLTSQVESTGSRSVGIILDNAGYELLCDLFLGSCLLSLKLADQIIFYTKKHPTFVSDATTADCLHTIRTLAQLPQDRYPNCRAMGVSWMEFLDTNHFVFSDDFFWCQPTGFRNLPPRISTQLSSHFVTFVKVNLISPPSVLLCLLLISHHIPTHLGRCQLPTDPG
jgi:hypothetical protein